MKKILLIIIFFLYVISCKKEESFSDVSNLQSTKLNLEKIKADVSISEGTILRVSKKNFEKLESYDLEVLLEDFNFFLNN
ncbi:hypothetical protein LPTSP2_33540 [Leptospira ellinghausenii]|uniref:Uncharacterized protein n=1 Tax=Leptospira ellinghausenii TaxID=1917822 RepID=A0A2P2DHG7_9LEPT|nr:hypothetical protein [Leptospira ellinghausenii]GBF44051.1 hypothetical protein LPTSP2_33540 [Leptospira ellinghausenii]